MPDKPHVSWSTTRKELIFFLLIAFAWSWMCHIPRVLASAGIISLSAGLSMALQYIAFFGPAAGAFILTGLQSGKNGMRTLWLRGWTARFKKVWFIPALLIVPASGLLTVLLLTIFQQPIAWEYSLPPAMIVPVALLIWLINGYPEEYGWRGYALDRLQARFSPLTASLLLGLVWGLWHLPLHFITGTTQEVIPIWEFMLQTILLTVIYTWLHNNSGGSILIASLFHASGNLTGALIPYWTSEAGRLISFATLLIPAGWIIWKHFTRTSRQDNAVDVIA